LILSPREPKILSEKIKYQLFPFLRWIRKVNQNTIKADLLAGLTGAVIVLPQGVAFAMIAGLPPIYGLYTAMITPIVAAMFGSSFHLISGPTTAISLVVFAAISQFAVPTTEEFIGLVLVLTLMAGCIQFVLGISRMGTLVNFVSHSVVIGFTSGAALLIGTSQIKHLLGINLETGLSFQESWLSILSNLEGTNGIILLVGLSTLAIAVLLKKIYHRLPNLLIAMVAGSVINYLLNGDSYGVPVVGELPSNLPPFRVPDISIENLQMLAPNAFAIALLGLIEAVAIGRSISNKSKQRIDGNQEFIGQGLSNIVGSFFSSYAGSGSFTRSGINFQAGAKTPFSAVFSAIILMGMLFYVAPLAAFLPIPAVGGIILLVAYNLIDFHHIRQILKSSKRETTVLLITFLATLFLDLEFAIYFGVFFSLVFYLQQTSKPSIVSMAPDPDLNSRKFVNAAKYQIKECPQLKILRIDGSIFFGAVDHVAARLDIEKHLYKHILLVFSGVNLCDTAGAELLVNEGVELKKRGGALYISSAKKNVRDVLRKGGYDKQIGLDNIFRTKEEAVTKIFGRLSRGVCDICRETVFLECDGSKLKPNFDQPALDRS